MGSRAAKRQRKRVQKRANEATQTENNDSTTFTLEAILSVVKSPQGMTKVVLRGLYFLLGHLWQNEQWRSSNGLESNTSNVEICKAPSKDVKRLSDVLFKELSLRFDRFFSALRNDLPNSDVGDGNSGLEMAEACEILNLLLRCCLVLLILLQGQQSLLLEKGRLLLQICQRLCSVNLNVKNERIGFRFENSVFRACDYGENNCATSTVDFIASLNFLEPSDSRLPLLSAMLEVMLDEVLRNKQLGSLFEIIDHLATSTGLLHMSDSGWCDSGLLLEIIFGHYRIAFLEKNAVEDFLDSLFWNHTERFRCFFRSKELSLSAAVMLLLNPVILSAPKVMQAHFIALVSEATANVSDFGDRKPDCAVINCSLTVFEKSVALYIKHISSSHIYSNLASSKEFEKSTVETNTILQSESLVSPYLKKKIYLTNMSDCCPESQLGNMSCKMKSDLVSSSIKYVKECQHVFHMSCQDEILSILSCIIVRVADGFCGPALHPIGGGDLQDFCVLASILKLMSNALLHVTGWLRHFGDSNCTKSFKDVSSSKEYEYIYTKISCFTEFSTNYPIQQVLRKMMGTKWTRHSNSRMMFLHFSGLLSFAFSTGLEFFVKGCLLTMMSLLNLLAFEDGNLDPLCSTLCSSSASFQTDLQQVNIEEAVLNRTLSVVVASKFQKIRTLCPSTPSPAYQLRGLSNGYCDSRPDGSVIGTLAGDLDTEVVTEESINGELYLRCVIENSETISDLADFVECKEGKNYSSWLKDRAKYRKWKGEKMAVMRWKRKKKTWGVIKSKRT